MFRLSRLCLGRDCRAIFGRFVLLLSLVLAPPLSARQAAIVIGNDRGGSVEARLTTLRHLRNSGTRVEIRGDYCLSACTMYLGLANVCTTPRTVFGFHGPSSEIYGIGLTPAAFEHWSQVMARHYPEPIRSWYLSVARNRTMGFYSVRGSDLIEMGVVACSTS